MIKWVVRLAWLAGILGLAGTLFIVYKISDPKKEVFLIPITAPDTVVIPEPVQKVDSPLISTEEKDFEPPDTVPVVKKPAEFEKDIAEPLPPSSLATIDVKSKEKILVNKPVSATNKRAGEKDSKKLFTQSELQTIVARVRKVSAQNKLRSNCVQLRIEKGNNNRTVAQIETYLKSKGFSIAGRETISEEVKGIKIVPKRPCVRLTIGSFY